MIKAMGKLLKFIIILIAILIGIGYFSGVEVSSSDNQTSSAAPISESSEAEKLAQAVGKEVEKNTGCKVGYYKNSPKSDCLKVPENALSAADNWYCKSGYIKSGEGCIKKVKEDTNSNNYYLDLYEESIKPSFILPKNAYVHNKAWLCNPAYVRVGDICKLKSTQGSSNSKPKPDKWWEKTKKYQICYGNVTAAHKANGLHTRNRDKSIEVKKQLCKIAATSTTGEGSFWLQ